MEAAYRARFCSNSKQVEQQYRYVVAYSAVRVFAYVTSILSTCREPRPVSQRIASVEGAVNSRFHLPISGVKRASTASCTSLFGGFGLVRSIVIAAPLHVISRALGLSSVTQDVQ